MCYAIFLPRLLPLSVHNLYNFHSIIDPPTLCLLCFQLKWMHKIRYCYAIAQTSHTDTLRGILPQLPRMPLMMPRQTLYNIASTSPTRTHYNLISPATLTNTHTNTTTPSQYDWDWNRRGWMSHSSTTTTNDTSKYFCFFPYFHFISIYISMQSNLGEEIYSEFSQLKQQYPYAMCTYVCIPVVYTEIVLLCTVCTPARLHCCRVEREHLEYVLWL